MRLRYKIGLFIIGIVSCTFLLQKFNKPTVIKGPAQITYSGGGDIIQIEHKDPKTGKITEEKIYEPDPKSTVITTDAKGNVTVKVRQFGVGTDFGIGIGYSDRPRVALDDRFAYLKRFGANVGLGFSLRKEDYQKGHLLDIMDPYLGGSYVPTTRLPNTSLAMTYAVSKHAFIFVRVRF